MALNLASNMNYPLTLTLIQDPLGIQFKMDIPRIHPPDTLIKLSVFIISPPDDFETEGTDSLRSTVLRSTCSFMFHNHAYCLYLTPPL